MSARVSWMARLGGCALALAGIALMAACTPPGGRDPAPRPRRIILFSMDTVRADHVSLYGRPGATPTLREIARQGIAFRRAYASSNYTIPSHMSIFTGLDPAEHGVHWMKAKLHPDVPTLASLFRQAGYRTRSFNDGHFVSARFGFDRGFDTYEELEEGLVSQDAMGRVIAWLRAAGDAPYFLFLHSYAAHFPYGGYERYRARHPERGLPDLQALQDRAAASGGDADPELHALCTLYNQLAPRHGGLLECGANRPGETFRSSAHFRDDVTAIVRSYDDRIRKLDATIALLRGTLIELGQWEDTLLVVTSDHGDAFFEHDLYRHGFVPFDEVMRVPLLISWPRLLAEGRGRVVDGLVSHLDILPTILGLAGLEPPDSLGGTDLTPVLLGEDDLPGDRAVFPAALRAAQYEQEPLRRIVVTGQWKWIDGHEEFGDAEGLLFDLKSDPKESRNQRTRRPHAFAGLRRRARDYEAQLKKLPPFDQDTGLPLRIEEQTKSPFEELDEGTQEQLRALGYAD